MTLDIIEPVGHRILIRKDDEKRQTKGGIHLPDDARIPVITGRVVALSLQIEHDEDYPMQKYDKVLVDPRNGIPVDFERDNKLYIIPVEDVVAVIRREPRISSENPEEENPEEENPEEENSEPEN